MRSSCNLANVGIVTGGSATTTSPENGCSPSDPIYAMPVKPFLSSQDVRNSSAPTTAAAKQQQFQRAEVVKQHKIHRSVAGARGVSHTGADELSSHAAEVRPSLPDYADHYCVNVDKKIFEHTERTRALRGPTTRPINLRKG